MKCKRYIARTYVYPQKINGFACVRRRRPLVVYNNKGVFTIIIYVYSISILMGNLPSSFCYDCKIYRIKCGGNGQRDFIVHEKQHTKQKSTSVSSTNQAPCTNCDEHIQKWAAARAAHLNCKRQTLCGILVHFCMFVQHT